ncbi:DeoR/GlpR transcriptional regulator [Bacillus sp. NMCC46]|uniref:DeoR/GlpR family DNA-binding transcription regulator n=1 Tax=Bacillus TaxID=1386 RepID=UPI00049F2DCE|nr:MULTISPECIES: DeoR/GlpR family DNA-binding transcription regulator [Bacillus]MCY7616856.1 DeoR/GlpR family DNA-binding transcription regulator [Bacillus pumilus]PRS44994.1 DeoR/GlpR transcriptional regulator [Bacillus sp. NMCC46]
MLKMKRIQQIKEYILKNQSVSLDDLVETFDVSKNTIRRDVQKLVNEGHIQKVYGGVAANHAKLEAFQDRQIRNQAQKRLIAREAASLVKDGDVIFIDSGTTTLELIHFIHNKQVTVVTNNVDFIVQAMPYKQLQVISTGGQLERKTKSFSNYSIAEEFNLYNFDKVFMASTGVSISNGVTNSSPVETSMKELVVKKGRDVFLLVDHTKFDKYAMVTYCGLDEIDYLITDDPLDTQYVNFIEENNIKLIVATDKG